MGSSRILATHLSSEECSLFLECVSLLLSERSQQEARAATCLDALYPVICLGALYVAFYSNLLATLCAHLVDKVVVSAWTRCLHGSLGNPWSLL